MKVLVTGANGFIGSALTIALTRAGHDVSAAIRQDNDSGIANTVFTRNIDAQTNWLEPLAEVTHVVHTAARVHMMQDTAEDPLTAFREVNTLGTLNLAQQAAKAGVKRFIFISTIGVSGSVTESHPFIEQAAPKPHNDYAKSKWEAEQGLEKIATETAMEVVIIRPPLVYGPKVKGNFANMSKWVERGLPLPLKSVENRRSLLALDNLVSFILLSLEHPDAANQLYLLADGEDVSTAELITRLADAMGKPSRLWSLPPDTLQFIGNLFGKQAVIERLQGSLQIDATKAHHLGWKPCVTMQQQLNMMFDKEQSV